VENWPPVHMDLRDMISMVASLNPPNAPEMQELFAVFGEPGALEILQALDDCGRALRFGELQQAANLEPIALREALNNLVEHGLVQQRVHCGTDRVDFSMTPQGAELAPMMDAFTHWMARFQY
jgi:DNA-binding HxlR family transcriptional regulator